MAEIERVVTRLRAALLRQDAEAQRAVVAAYRTATKAIGVELDALTERMASAIENGDEIGPSWLYRQERYRALLDQAEAAMAQYTTDAGNVITAAQREAVRTAQTDAATLTLAAMGEAPVGVGIGFSRLPEEALTELLGTLQPGSPLRGLLETFGRDVAAAVSDALIEGLALGHGPNKVAAAVRRGMGGEAWKARRIARTELLRSYRSAALRTMQANARDKSGVVTGWTWFARLDRRCCPSCIAMHGTHHRLDERMSEHPSGRCVMLPRTVSWKDLGYNVPDERPVIEPGPDVFARWPKEDQLFALGPKAYTEYENGNIELPDLVSVRRSNRWGTTRSVAAVDEALANAEARRRKAA